MLGSSWGAVHVSRGRPRLRGLCVSSTNSSLASFRDTFPCEGRTKSSPVGGSLLPRHPGAPACRPRPSQCGQRPFPLRPWCHTWLHPHWMGGSDFQRGDRREPLPLLLPPLSYPDKLTGSSQRCAGATAREPSPPALQAPSACESRAQHRAVRCFLPTSGKSVLTFSEFPPPNCGSGTKQVPSEQGFDA